MHSADYVSARKEVYVFRGGNGREYLNDLHALSVTSLEWKRVETTGAIPQQRANHSSAILEETGELFIFGGWNGTERLNDIHILDTATSNWTFPRIGGILPHPRAGMTLTALRGRLYLFGGSGTSAKCFQDLQILDRQGMTWLDVSQFDDSVRGQYGGPPAFEADFRFGGYNNNHNFRFASAAEESGGAQDGEISAQPPQGGAISNNSNGSMGGLVQYSSSRADWHSREMANNGSRPNVLHQQQPLLASPNPNDEDTVPSVLVNGQGPGRRAGHTATAVHRKIYVFGGSCGSDYLNDFFVLDTDPSPHVVVTEPTSLQLFERRLRHFFNDEEFSDVTFLVQGQKVYGHKMVLSIVSDCFRAMFTTGFRESDQMEIEIPDCSHAAFLAVMKYIYTGELPSLDFQRQDSRDRNVERVVEMLELADRFFLDHLKQICETMLQSAVSAETIEYFLAVAQKTNATQLQNICEHFLRNREARH